MMRRKLFISTLFFIAGILASYFVFLLSTTLLLAILPLIKFSKIDFKQTVYKIIVCFFIFGFVLMSFEQFKEIKLNKCACNISKKYTGTVKSVKIKKCKEGLRTELIVSTTNLNGNCTSAKVLVKKYMGKPDDFKLYRQKIVFLGKLEIPKINGNPRCFNYNLHLKSKGIHFVSDVSNIEVMERRNSRLDELMRYIFLKREDFINELDTIEDVKGIIKGILFGDTSLISENVQDEFRDNGTAHILAVSGLHIGLLYSIYRRVMRFRRKRIYCVLFVIFLVCYGSITFWSISVSRAIGLVFLKLLSDRLDYRFDLLSSLSGICLIALVGNPWAIFGADFQMSFLALLSIAFLVPFLSKKIPEEFAAAIGVQLGILPYVSFTFNKIPVISILCNIPIIMVLSILLPLGMICFFTYFLNLNSLINLFICAMGNLLIKLNAFINFKGFFTLDTISLPLFFIVLFYMLMFFISSELFFILKNRKQYGEIFKIVFTTFAIAVICFCVDSDGFDKAFCTMVDVGQGDCFHVTSKGGENIIFDGGGKAEYNVGEKVLKPYFLKNRIKKVDVAFVTHLHVDHYKGVEELGRCFNVKKIIYKGRVGDRYRIGNDIVVNVIWPEKQDFTVDDENKNSLIFKVNVNGLRILITGDISKEGEEKLVERYRGTDVLKCDVLKVSHHGSKYSSSDEFLKEVNPRVAVIGVGKNNYGHPSDEVIEKLREKGIITYRTDSHGAVGIIKERGRIRVCHQRKNRSEVFGTLQWIIKKVH